MRRDFIRQVTQTKSAFLREISQPVAENEIDARIKKIVDSEDPDLIWDLRIGKKGREFFSSTVKQYIEVQTAVDDRRHDTVDRDDDVVTHLAVAMSAQDLNDAVKERCPENTPLPSLQ